MPYFSTLRIRNWATIAVVTFVVAAVILWFIRTDRLPRKIRIATGAEQGMYTTIGKAMSPGVAKRTKRSVNVVLTEGSRQNLGKLKAKEVELAIIQGGSVPMDDLTVIAPLVPEFIFVICRKSSKMQSFTDLKGKKVALGTTGSGSRSSALDVLRHFNIPHNALLHNKKPFQVLLKDSSYEAAIATAGIQHTDIRKLLADPRFELMPIDSAAAVDVLEPHLRAVQIPAGMFRREPAYPSKPMTTLATTAYLVARKDVQDALVRSAVEAIYTDGLRNQLPTLIKQQEVNDWVPTRLHPAANRYFNPSDDIGQVANVMESLAATKELLFALGAGIYLLWLRWRRLKEQETAELISVQKERLDDYLEETLEIERAQLATNDVAELTKYLEQVTDLKLKTLHEFTEEQLRGDQAFSIFIDQCAALINKIQLKIIANSK